MSEFTEITQTQAIKVMEDNLKKIKEYSGCDTFLLLSYNLENGIPIQNRRLNREEGMELIKCCKSFTLNKDSGDDDVSVLSMYTELQKDIHNIQPTGKKHDIIIIKLSQNK